MPFVLKDSSFQKDIKEIMKPTLEQLLKKDIKTNKYTDYAIEYHLSSIFGVITFWIQNKKDISVDELFYFFQQVITKGIFNIMKEL